VLGVTDGQLKLMVGPDPTRGRVSARAGGEVAGEDVADERSNDE
jgi:hypothetical protein